MNENPLTNLDDAGIILLVKQGNANEEQLTDQIDKMLLLGNDAIVVRKDTLLSSTRNESPVAFEEPMMSDTDIPGPSGIGKKILTEKKTARRGGTRTKRPGDRGKTLILLRTSQEKNVG